MIVRKVFPDIPTTTVALDLLSRVGSETKYSLSPFKGFAAVTLGYEKEKIEMREDNMLESLVRQKDCFNFYHQNVFYSVAQYMQDLEDLGVEDIDEYDVSEDSIVGDDEFVRREDVPVYTIDSTEAPAYVRRFEDYNSVGQIKDFINTVIHNSYTNKDGYLKRKEAIGRQVSLESDTELVNENELAVDEIIDADEQELISRSSSALIRSMYRLILLSRELKVSMISILLAYCRFYKHSSSRIECKPQLLREKGPVYRVNSDGDCTAIVADVNCREVKRAREVYWTKPTSDMRLVEEFRSDCDTFLKCIANLSINAEACDARNYTFAWAVYYSRKTLVNNYTYVLRKSGGYSVDVLNQLRVMSLDTLTNAMTENSVDYYGNMVAMIDDLEGENSVPPFVIADLRRSNSMKVGDTIMLLEELFSDFEQDADTDNMEPVLYESGLKWSTLTTAEGFLVSEDRECLYTVNAQRLLPKNALRNFTYRAFVHCTGWLVFEPISNFTYVVSLEDLKKFRNSPVTDYTRCPKYICGPEREEI